MSNISDSFTKLLGRQATDAEIQKMYRVRDALDLKDNDALWVIAMTLQSYQTEFDKIPGAISKASVDALANIKSVADSAISASLLKAQMDMHAAAVSVFGGLADEAKAVVINAGRDIAAVDRANVEIALKRDNFKLLTASVAGAVVLSVAGFFGGRAAESGLAAAEIASLKAAATASANNAAAAVEAAERSKASAISEATKTLNAQLDRLTARVGWLGTKDGAAVSGCTLDGWQQRNDTATGNPFCIVREAESKSFGIFGKDITRVDFWMPKAPTNKN